MNLTCQKRVPENGTCVITVRCVQCASLIDLGPFDAESIKTLGEIADMMIERTICDGCIGVLMGGTFVMPPLDCTGHIDELGLVVHEGDTCPVCEDDDQ